MIAAAPNYLLSGKILKTAALVGLSVFLAVLITVFGITMNQTLALLVGLIIFTVWQYDKCWATIFALSFDAIKPLLIRVIFAAEDSLGMQQGFDLLGIMPSLVMIVLIISELGMRQLKGESIFPDRPRRLLLVFTIIGFLSIFNPANSVMVGLGGFQRNIMPNMLILFLAASVFKSREDIDKLLKAFLVIGLASIVYGLCQYAAGILPWEKDWFLKVAFKDNISGWMTIGFRGIEFRIYSFFYSYAGFFYTNVLIFSLLLAMGERLPSRYWRRARILYFILWAATLVLTLERMTFIMTVAAMSTVFYLKSPARRKKAIVWVMILGIGFGYGGLKIATPYLVGTGVEKMGRIAELANPFSANSIEVRKELIWAPAIEIIRSHPMGMGIGFGSATKTSDQGTKWSMNAQPHNEVLQKAMETGLVGAAVFVLLLISVFRLFLTLAKDSSRFQTLGMGLVAATAAFWLCSLVNLTFSGTPGLIYWSLAGVALSTNNINKIEKVGYQSLDNSDKVNDEVMQPETYAYGKQE